MSVGCCGRVCAGVGALVSLSTAAVSFAADRDLELFDRVWELVNEQFYDPQFHGVDWAGVRARVRPQVQAADSARARRLVREMLAELRASHTELLAPDELRYYHLLDVFYERDERPEIRALCPDGRVHYTGIGVFCARHDGATLIQSVWDGFPAQRAGLRMGDRILAADGAPFHEMDSFRGRAGRPVTLRVQSESDPSSARDVLVTPVEIEPGHAFLRAEALSTAVISRGGVRVGYVHVWSYAGLRYHLLLEELVADAPLNQADALVLDLRDGLGGADPAYLNLFNQRVPVLESRGRGESFRVFDRQWRKPVVLLVNERTTSGKEIFAYGFQKHGLGVVVGSRTAGAVLGGRIFPLPERQLLYLAVADVRVDGERLEGVGVVPDLEIPLSVPSAAGADVQRDGALDCAARLVQDSELPQRAGAASGPPRP